MSKETKKNTKSQQTAGTHVFTFRADSEKSVGVSVWLAEAPNGGPAYLYYGPGDRAYESKQTKKTAYSKKFFARNAEAHAEAILKAGAFMNKYSDDPVAALEAGAALKSVRTTNSNGGAQQAVNGEAASL